MLKGDLKKAIETHQMLYEVSKKHTFLPEVKLSVNFLNNLFGKDYQRSLIFVHHCHDWRQGDKIQH